MKLKELEQKYAELSKEIEKLKAQQDEIGYKDDPIFLLSIEEYEKYKNKIPELRWLWRLRSPGCNRYTAASVCSDGSVYYTGNDVLSGNVCVRPALNLKYLSPLQYKIVSNIVQNGIDSIVACGTTWIKLTDNIYIAEMPIGFEKFDDDSNDYETSYIRKWLLYWFEERKNW